MRKIILFACFFLLAAASALAIANFIVRDKIEIPPGFAGRYIEVSGMKIRFRQIGTGPDLFFVHGSPGSLEDWEPVVRTLSARYRLTFYDRPGHGFSSPPRDGFGLEQNAQIASALLRRLEIKDPILVGHSYGGSVLLAMAVRGDLRSRAFVVIAPPAFEHVSPGPLFSLIRIPVLGRGFTVFALRLVDPSAMHAPWLRAAFHPDEHLVTSDFLALRARIWGQTKTTVAMASELTSLQDNLISIRSKYGNINNKLFIIQGLADTRFLPGSRALHRAVPGSRLILLDNVGHYVQQARPEVLTRVIDESAGR